MWFRAVLLAAVMGVGSPRALAEGNGQEELDEALRVKVTAENLRDLNKVVELLETAIDEGLDVENSDFAEQLLVEVLLERSAQLAAVVQSVPLQKLEEEEQLQRVRGLAVTDLRRVLEYDGAPVQAKVLLAQLLSLSGDERAEALKLLDELFEDKATAVLPVKMQAEAYSLRATLQDDPAKAQADFDAAIKLEPNEAQHRMARADFLRRQGKLDEAVADIDAVVEQNPDAAAAFLVKAQVLREQNKLNEALAALDKATALAPSAPEPYQQRGEIYRLQDDPAKAIEQFNRVLQMQPGFLLTLIHRAEAYLANKQYDEALVDIEAVLKDNPKLTVAHGLRAQALASLERMPEAIAEMRALAEATPQQPEFRMQLALYYLVDKQPREAIREYGEIIKGDAAKDEEPAEKTEGEQEQDDDGEEKTADEGTTQGGEPLKFQALRGRADAYLNIGEHAEAVKDFDAALKINAEDTGVLNNFAWVLATSPDEDVRDGKRAVELATKAVELTDEKEAHILSTLAAAYAETGDFEAARKWSQKSVDMQDPEHADQLAKELASYKENKPWRERQTGEESEKPAEEEKPADEPKNAPATAETPAKPVSF
jgi:tetratricopeptide (TPR) repeat protein